MTHEAGQIRIRIFGVLFILAFCVIAVRAYQLQVAEAPELQARADQQRHHVIKLAPRRGTIVDRNGSPLALSLEVDSLYADPVMIQDPAATAKKLASLLKIPQSELVRTLSADGRRFVWLQRMMDPEVADAVRQLRIPGLAFVSERKRYYPQSAIGAHVVGFTGLDPRGLEGIELEYDRWLQGEPELLISTKDARGRGLASAEAPIQGGASGHNLQLTLDRALQYIAERELARVVRESDAIGGTLIMLEPASGRILALASWPYFNPNLPGRYAADQRRNRAICDVYEPGSTFKPFLLAGVLEEGLMTPEQTVYCEQGRYSVGGSVVRDSRKFGHLTLEEMLKFSSNIGFVKLGKELERDRYYRYLQSFGFGSRTGVDFPGEVTGLIRPSSRWFEIDLAAISFGQGISVTPIQMAAAMGAIANGGLLMEPYLVETITDADHQVIQRRLPEVRHRVISEKTAAQVRRMMVAVTEPGGTGVRGAVPGFRVAGKTGTAQKVDAVTGGYSIDKRIASFIGFVPAESPALVIAVTVDEPKGMVYGGQVAAPVFSRVAVQALNHLNILPHSQVATLPVASVYDKPLPDLAPLLSSANADDGLVMPNFRGMSYRQVLQAMEQQGLNLKLTGSGRAVEQYPRAGELIPYGKKAWVRFGA
ncbi:MAG: transpeptidase family protein [Desulfuromonadales bacterium]|nr:transpeptidase family protein [Desulfuromonadales bacterium]